MHLVKSVTAGQSGTLLHLLVLQPHVQLESSKNAARYVNRYSVLAGRFT
jgi:hypothetical protein